MLTHVSQGAGDPVVLLHAFPLSHAMWLPVTEAWPRKRFVLPDLPGFGRSPRLGVPSIAGMAAEVAALLDHAGVAGPVALGGLSMGGYVALEFIRQFPERVSALGLFATRAAPDTPQQQEGRRQLIARIEREGASAVIAASLPKLLGETARRRRPQLVGQLDAWIRAAAPAALIDALAAMAERRDARPWLSAIRCPTLVLAGDEDAVIPATEAEGMARSIPHASFALVPASGHLINLEAPERFLRGLSEWLGPA